MSGFTVRHKKIARIAWDAFAGEERATCYWDEREQNWVAIIECRNSPTKGVTSFATVGISDHPLYQGRKIYRPSDGNAVRCEFVCACRSSKNMKIANAIATAAFCVINSSWFCCPGVIFPDVLAMYHVSKTMRHFYFMSPFLWQDRLPTLEYGKIQIAWLQAIPISQSERELVDECGAAALESLFEERQIDVYDLNRKSVI